jgi:hypothetical protein
MAGRHNIEQSARQSGGGLEIPREPIREGCWTMNVYSLGESASPRQAASGETGTTTPDGSIEVTGDAPGLFSGVTRYVVPPTGMRSAIGLPLYFTCFSNDRNAPESPFTAPGFFIAPDINISFKFYEPKYPRSEWPGLFERMRAALRNMIID